jgi:G3E family GTPase
MMEVTNGCICCTLRGNLLAEMRRLAAAGRVVDARPGRPRIDKAKGLH